MENQPKIYCFGVSPAEAARIDAEDRRAARLVASSLAVGIACAAAIIVSAVAQQPARTYWFDLYSADRGAAPGDMRWQLRMGPFRELSICYATAALGMDALDAANPSKDFAGRCEDGPLMTLRAVTDGALALLPKQKAAP